MGERVSQVMDLELRAASGPDAACLHLQSSCSPLTLGRRSTHPLQLNDPAVSRDHAALTFEARPSQDDTPRGEWRLTDLGSTHGTWLNGVRLRPNRPYHLRVGDLLAIGPWTLQVVDRSGSPRGETTLATLRDAGAGDTFVASVDQASAEALTAEGSAEFYTLVQRVHAADDLALLARAVLDAAIDGGGFRRVAFLRPLTDEDSVTAVEVRGFDTAAQAESSVSHALIQQAAGGSAAELRRGAMDRSDPNVAGETNQLVALCVPIMVASTLTAYLYFDVRATESCTADQAKQSAFTLARVAAMGVSNLMRIDIQRRQERMQAELDATAEAQRWLLPKREGECGPLTYVGETRTGVHIGGDFFDFIPLGDDQLGVVLGDVGGRGIRVSVLVTAAQAFLHASLRRQGDAAAAVAGVDELFLARISHSQSLKLWVGVFDPNQRKLEYVSAGYGAAMMVAPGGHCTLLEPGRDPCIGVGTLGEYHATAVAIEPAMRLVMLSDGFLEQRAADNSVDDETVNRTEAATESTKSPDRPCFGIVRAQQVVQGMRPIDDPVTSLFSALESHAGSTNFDDDATAVIVRW